MQVAAASEAKRERGCQKREGDCPNRSGCPRRPKSARRSPEPSKPSKTERPLQPPQTHRTTDGTSALPRAFLNGKGRAIVPIAAAVRAAKKCPPKSRTIKTQQNRTAITPRPRPPHCGWDIRPPASTNSLKGRAIVPIAAVGKTAKKCPPESRTIKTQQNRTAVAPRPRPPHCGWDIRPPASISQR